MIADQYFDGVGFERLGAIALDVGQSHENLQRLIFHHLPRQPEHRFHYFFGILPAGRRLGQTLIVFGLHFSGEQILPNIQPARQMGFAVGIQAQASGEQHQIRIRPEHRTRRPGTGNPSAQRHVKALDPLRIRQIGLHRPVDARQRVVVGGQPSVVLLHQPLEERGAFVGRDAYQVGPRFLGAGAAGHHRLAVAQFEHGAEKVQHVRVDFRFGDGQVLAHLLRRFGIQRRGCRIQAADRGFVQKVIDEFDRFLARGRRLPVIGGIKNGHARRVIIQRERPIGAQRRFQFR